MSNNLINASGEKPRNTSVGSDQKKFWELRNKDKRYKEVVSASIDVGGNARGHDNVKRTQDSNAVKALR